MSDSPPLRAVVVPKLLTDVTSLSLLLQENPQSTIRMMLIAVAILYYLHRVVVNNIVGKDFKSE